MRDQYPSWSPWEAAQSQDISLHLQLKGTLACSRGGLDIEGGDSVYQTHQSDPYHCSRMFFTLGNGHSQVLPTKEHHRNVPQQWDTTVTMNLAVPPLPIRTLLPRWESGFHRPSFALNHVVAFGKGTRTAGNMPCVTHHRVRQLSRTRGTAFTAAYTGITMGYQLLTHIQPLFLPPAVPTPLKMS